MANIKNNRSALPVLAFAMLVLGYGFGAAASQLATASSLLALRFEGAQTRPTSDSAQNCLQAAKKALGPEAQVLKCGHLTGTDALEAIAAIRLKQLRENHDGIPVSKLVVLRHEKSQWTPDLTVDRNSTRNSVGYIAMDFIDDTPPEIGFRVLFSDKGTHQVAPGFTRSLPGFTITLTYLGPKGEREDGVPVDIIWNQAVGRFQEYTENQEPEGFQPEKKNLPHIRSRDCISCGKK